MRSVVTLVLLGLLAPWQDALAAGEPALLAGPKVSVADPRRSLVRVGADGVLELLDDREEIAALDLLGLTPEEREPIDRLVRLRVAEVMSGGLSRIPILLELQEAIASGEDARVDDVLRRFGATRPTWANPTPLDHIIERALPEHARSAYRELVEEYRAAWLREKRDAVSVGSRDDGRSGMSESEVERTSDALHLARLEREKKLADIRKPTEASLAEARERFERIGRRLELTPQQEGRIQTLIQEYATGTNFKPRPRDGLKLIADVFGVLTWSQRAEMLRYLREENQRPRWRPLRDAPQGTLMAAGVPLLLVVGRRKRKRHEPRA